MNVLLLVVGIFSGRELGVCFDKVETVTRLSDSIINVFSDSDPSEYREGGKYTNGLDFLRGWNSTRRDTVAPRIRCEVVGVPLAQQIEIVLLNEGIYACQNYRHIECSVALGKGGDGRSYAFRVILDSLCADVCTLSAAISDAGMHIESETESNKKYLRLYVEEFIHIGRQVRLKRVMRSY